MAIDHFWVIIKMKIIMKKRSIVLLGILAVLLNSCVYSLFPIYTEDTLVFKEELVGKWSAGEEGVHFLFESMGKKTSTFNTEQIEIHEESYKLTLINDDVPKEAFVAHLVEIGDDLFMDLFPLREFSSKNISDNFFPVHTFYKVEITENEFTMTYFDLDKLNKLFESNRIRLRHENVDGTIMITAQPKELQKFIDKYSDDESVFDYTETYKRAS